MLEITALFFGVVLLVALTRFARTKTPARERRIYAFGLMVAAAIYVVFAVTGGAGAEWLLFESLGVIIYGGAAVWAVLRAQTWLIALAWGAHVAWDVSFHLHTGGGAEYTPDWYPWLCASFDLVIAYAVFTSGKRDPADSQSTT